MYEQNNSRVTDSATVSMNRRLRQLAVGFSAICVLLVGAAEDALGEWQDTDDITAAAERYVYQNGSDSGGKLIATAGYLDPRLTLTRCTENLEPFVRPGTQLSGRIIVGVRCKGEKNWKVYLPVHIGIMNEMIVTARSLSRGHIVGPDDIVTEYRDVSRLRGAFFRNQEDVVGRRIVRSLARGVALQRSQLEDQTLVEKGQSVTISVKSASINIQMAGIAESDGSADELIPIRNLGSGKIIEGRVRSRILVEVE